MDAKQAFSALADFIGEAESFIETFEHEDHGDEDGECRFDIPTAEALKVIERLVAASEGGES